jgi:hypothetical protein
MPNALLSEKMRVPLYELETKTAKMQRKILTLIKHAYSKCILQLCKTSNFLERIG